MTIEATLTADRIFTRAQAIARDAEAVQIAENETEHETILRLSFRIAKLEHADTKDEYSTD